jgi:hypothetical protein
MNGVILREEYTSEGNNNDHLLYVFLYTEHCSKCFSLNYLNSQNKYETFSLLQNGDAKRLKKQIKSPVQKW